MAYLIITFISAHEENPGVDEVSGLVHSAAHGPFENFRRIKRNGYQQGVSLDPREGKGEEDTTSYCLLSTHVA